MSNDGNDLLMSSGGTPWAKWPKVGTVVTGEVVSLPSQRQSRDFDSGDPAEWPNGDPKMEVSIGIQTTERDADIEDDNGIRQVVLPTGTERFKAVQAAVRTSGAKGVEVGGVLTVKFVSEQKHEKRGFNPIKKFEATYVAPGAAALAGAPSEQAAMNALAGLVK